MKTCKKCGQDKPLDQFEIKKARGQEYRRGACRECMKAYFRSRHGKHGTPPPSTPLPVRWPTIWDTLLEPRHEEELRRLFNTEPKKDPYFDEAMTFWDGWPEWVSNFLPKMKEAIGDREVILSDGRSVTAEDIERLQALNTKLQAKFARQLKIKGVA